MIPGSYRHGGPLRLLTIALAATVLLLVGVVYDVWVGARVTPSLLRYVPPGSEGYVITGPLGEVLSNGQAHPFFTEPDVLSAVSGTGGLLQDVVAFAMRIQGQCTPLNSAEDLKSVGIDPTQGLALAVIDQQNHDYVAIVPTLDQKEFARFVRAVLSPWYQMTLAPIDRTKPVNKFRIVSNTSSGAQFCLNDQSTTGGLPSGTSVPTNFEAGDSKSDHWKEAHFHVGLAENDHGGRVALECAAEYLDGSVGACQCTIDGADCSEEKTLAPVDTKTTEDFATIKGLAAVKIEALGDKGIFLAFPDSRTALLATSAQSAAAALDGKNNFHAFESDDSLRIALRQVLGKGTEDAGVIFGALAVAYPPIFGSVHFSAIVDRVRIESQVFLPWQTLEQTILHHVLSISSNAYDLQPGTSQFAEIQASDPFLGSYLNYFKTYLAGTDDAYFGNFAVILRAVKAESNLTKLALSFEGLGDGVPHFLLSIKIGRNDAAEFLLKQRQALRQARDIEILKGAAQRFIIDHNGYPPAEASQLERYLEEEPDALWSQYTIEPGAWGAPAVEINQRKAATDFDSDAYHTEDDGHLLQFVSPAFTMNDRKFRLSGKTLSSAEVDILKSNRYRMVAYYDESTGLLVSTDQETLGAHLSLSNNGPPKRRTKENVSRTKLRFDSRPRALYSQMQNEPKLDEDIKAYLGRYLGAVGKYNRLYLLLAPRPVQNGLLVRWGASYD